MYYSFFPISKDFSMQIAPQKVVVLDYTLTSDDGSILDKSEGGQFAYLHGAENIIPGLEKALTDKKAGDKLNITVSPEEGYGARNESMMQVVPRDAFDSEHEIQVGQQFHAQSADGHPIAVTISAIEGDNITIDGNHPFAGINLNFDVEVVEVRDASAEEISHGHVHGPGGHHHD